MAEKSSILFEILVPWANRPMRIRASGVWAVAMAAGVAIAVVLIIKFA